MANLQNQYRSRLIYFLDFSLFKLLFRRHKNCLNFFFILGPFLQATDARNVFYLSHPSTSPLSHTIYLSIYLSIPPLFLSLSSPLFLSPSLYFHPRYIEYHQVVHICFSKSKQTKEFIYWRMGWKTASKSKQIYIFSIFGGLNMHNTSSVPEKLSFLNSA